MILEGVWRAMDRDVFSRSSTDTLFNFYAAERPSVDRKGAGRIRRQNLRNYLDSFPAMPSVLVVGEAPGPWGCRYSGVPFTSEQQLCSPDFPFRGKQSSTEDHPHSERSATIFWNVLRDLHPHFLIWNALPLHPHPVNDAQSLRRPAAVEVAAFSTLLRSIADEINPKMVVAVGRVAEQAVGRIGIVPIYVRHPSRGGMKDFTEGMRRVFADLQSINAGSNDCIS
jgi:hypothetical protein